MHIVVTIPSTGISYDAKLRWQSFYVHTQITERNTHFTEFPENCSDKPCGRFLVLWKPFHGTYSAGEEGVS